MARQSATIRVFCQAETLQDTANMLRWAIGRHRIEVADTKPQGKIACLLVFTDVEYYENDATLLESLGFDIIGKIRGVVWWEVLPRDEVVGKTRRALAFQNGDDLEAKFLYRLYRDC